MCLLYFIRKYFNKKSSELLSTYSEREIIQKSIDANFFGLQSLGRRQVRGNGLLILTEREVIFYLYVPKKEFRIPLKSIIRIDSPKSHLGKTKSRLLLKIVFTNNIGEEDSIAWNVGDLESWILQLNTQINK